MRTLLRTLSAIGALAFLLLLPTVAGVVLARPAGAQESDGRDPSLELAQRYAPIVAIRTPDTLCGEGEPHAPAAVESVLGRDDVALVGPDGQVVTTAPTAADLFGLGEGYHLDLPGNPLDPGCTYATWWADMAADHPPTVYARVTDDPDRPGTVVVQYWLWWIFNDWNDKHEGDWEMVQVVFDADSPEQALTVAPRQVVFAQHEGAHYVEWDDEEDLVRDGDRVVTHPGAGSEAVDRNRDVLVFVGVDADDDVVAVERDAGHDCGSLPGVRWSGAGRAGRTGLRWDLVDQALMRSLPARPAARCIAVPGDRHVNARTRGRS